MQTFPDILNVMNSIVTNYSIFKPKSDYHEKERLNGDKKINFFSSLSSR